MDSGHKNKKYQTYLCLFLLCIISVGCTQSSPSTKGKVIEIDPNSV